MLILVMIYDTRFLVYATDDDEILAMMIRCWLELKERPPGTYSTASSYMALA